MDRSLVNAGQSPRYDPRLILSSIPEAQSQRSPLKRVVLSDLILQVAAIAEVYQPHVVYEEQDGGR